MGKLHRSRSPTQHDHRTRNARLRKHGIAIPVAALGQSRHRDLLDSRTGGQQESLRGPLPDRPVRRANFDGMRVHKSRPAAKERKAAALQLLGAVLCKLGHHPLLAGMDFFRRKSQGTNGESKFPGVACCQVPVGGFDERLAWHATAQDAQPSHFLCSLHHCHPQFLRAGGGSGGIPGASPSENNKIEVFHGERGTDYPLWSPPSIPQLRFGLHQLHGSKQAGINHPCGR